MSFMIRKFLIIARLFLQFERNVRVFSGTEETHYLRCLIS